MPVSIPEFWNLMLASRLASPVSLSNLQAKFNQVKGAETESNAATLAQWLITQGTLSVYQAKVLLAGRPGPFSYGEYTVYDRIATGRLQGAFRALHPPTRHRVLLWFHSGPIVQNSQWWSVVVDQIAQAARVVHPHVARVYHLCDLGQFKFTAIEDLQGESVDAQLSTGPIHWAIACRMVRQAALGLGRMHELKQLHGAVRPQNIWLDKEENVKLLLTPIARSPLAIPGPIDLAATQHSEDVLRQADYLAPELGQAGQPPGPWTDIYALGCTLFHLLSGRPPFSGRDVLSKLASHSSERVPSLEAASVPAPIMQVLAVMMAKDPGRRFQRARQVADALTQVLEQLDPAQLRWPASTISNKLPEYESWLQPYQLASDTQKHWAPEIQTPPILAASLRAQESRPALEFDPQAAPAPPSTRSSAADVATASRTWSGGNALRTTPPPIRHAPPAAAPASGLTASGANLPGDAPAPRRALTGPAPSILGDQPSAMIFPPDDADAVIPFGTTSLRHRDRGKRRMLISVAAVGAFMLILLFVLLSNRPQPHETPNDESNSTTATAPVNNKDLPNPNEAGKAEAKPNARESDVKTTAPHSNQGDVKEDAPPRTGPSQKDSNNSSSSDLIHHHGTLKHRFMQVAFAIAGDQNDPANKVAGSAKAISRDTKLAGDSGNVLWASPTHGSPISLAHLAPGVQAVLALRPADLMRRADRDKIFASLGPAGEAAARELKSYTGASLAEIDQLLIAWVDQIGPGAEMSIVPMYVFCFRQPADLDKLRDRWEYPAMISEGLVYQTPRGFSVYLPAKENGKVLVVGPADCLKEVVKLDGEPPPVHRAMEQLLLASDDQRMATLLWMPNSELVAEPLAKDAGPWEMVLDWARQFFGDDIRAFALSAQLMDDNLFLELAVKGPLGETPETVARRLREKLARLPGNVERYVSSLNLQPYDRTVLVRFPQMIGSMRDFTRSGAQVNLAVLRCYLPAAAAHNLLLATELMLAESANQSRVNPGGGGGSQTNGTVTIETVERRLQHVTSLSFARDTLEKAIQMLADDIGVQAEIIGPDLQLEGITKNQSFSLDEKEKPAAEILRVIMLRANPDGKLVYVVKPRAAGGEEMLQITTRAAAAKRGDKLPPELVSAPVKK